MESPAHGATAGGEHKLDLGDLIDFHSEIPVIQSSPELLTWENLHPSGSVGLLFPSSSTSVLCRSGSAAAFRISAYISLTEASGSALALWLLGFTLAKGVWLSASDPAFILQINLIFTIKH